METVSLEKIKYKTFEVAKYVATDIIGKKKVFVDYETKELRQRLSVAGLSDEMVLLKLLEKGCEEHNSEIEAKRTRIRSLNFNKNWKDSVLLRGIDWRKIDKLVKENIDEDTYKIGQLYLK